MASKAASLYSNTPEGSPNILIIQTDDQGWDDFGFMHEQGAGPETPNLDLLSSQSVNFSNFYVHSQCAPTRAALLTGKHPFRAGVWGVHGGTDHIDLGQKLLPEYLQEVGYQTAHFGKWHSGKTDGYWPWDRGFDDSQYAELYIYRDNTFLTRNGRLITEGWTEARIADAAIDFIEQHQDHPFFLYYCPITPHTGVYRTNDTSRGVGVHAPEELIDKYENKGLSPELSGVYAGIEFLDTQIGRILDELDRLDLAEDTLVIFLSDNGPLRGDLTNAEWALRNPSALRGQKSRVWENGLRSQLFLRWPGNPDFGAGTTLDTITEVEDLLPTLVEIAGGPDDLQEVDGINLLPLIASDDSQMYEDRAIRRISGASWIGINLNVELDTDLRPKADARYLAYTSTNNRIQAQRSIRKENLKLSYSNLYDFNTKGGRSETLVFDSPEELQSLDQDFGDWWAESVLTSPYAFSKPVYQIEDFSSESTLIYPHGAVNFTSGTTRPRQHYVDGFTNLSDFIRVKVLFKEPGKWRPVFVGKTALQSERTETPTFELSLLTSPTESEPYTLGSLQLQTSQRPIDEQMPPNTILHSSDDLESFFGQPFIIPRSLVNQPLLLEISLTDGSSSNPIWDELREIIFVPSADDIDPTEWATMHGISGPLDTTDSNSNGLPDLLDWALGGDPTSAERPIMPTFEVDKIGAPDNPLKYTLHYRKGQLDHYKLLSSDNLSTWSDPFDIAISSSAIHDICDAMDSKFGFEAITVTLDDLPEEQGDKGFLRLQIIE